MVSIAPSPFVHPAQLASALVSLRSSTPLIQCLTNTVVTNVTANVLLAIGAAPAMADLPGEAAEFATIASGVLVNLGTPYAEQREGMMLAAAAANVQGTPWVLDPVAVGALAVRTELAHRLLELSPTVIRGNASEIMALSGSGGGGRGVDATDGVEAAREAALDLARRTGAVVAVSGPIDLVTDGTRTVLVHGGNELLTRITGGGCSLGAVCAAFAADADDVLAAVVAAHAYYALASERAAAKCAGPGSFAMHFIDELAAISAEDLAAKAVIA